MINSVITNLLLILILIFFVCKYLHYRYGKETFQKLLDHINIGYYRYRIRDGVVLAANKGFIRILELDMRINDIIGRSVNELLIYVDGEKSIRDQLRTKKELRNFEYHFKTLKGRDKYVLHNSYVIRDPYSREQVIEAFIEDVTEERLSREKMRESQERYEKLFRNSGDMVVICRLDDFIIEEVNPITKVITGFSEDELIGESFEKLFHPSRKKELKEAREDLLFRAAAALETVVVCRNGTYKEVLLTLSVIDIKEERIAMAVVKDVSALVKETEEQKRRKKELEDFWKASVEREERIKELHRELERAKQQIRLMKEKYGTEHAGGKE
ncbi:MAG: PAS domain S-box protein [Candidatus Omnitrophota bacterium]|nr:PAS domain S-box protein [Candidatus Omnitrophota bacterium]